MVGYLLIPETCAQKAFVLVGAGGAGKSTLLTVVQELLLGRENVANVPWQSLADRFKTAEIFGKLANIFADLPSRSIEDNGIFKSITGEDMVIAERKNKDPFAFRATARLVFSCNEIPRNLGDRSAAFYRRLVIIPFRPPKPEALRDLKLKDSFKAEAPGILNWALAGLLRLRENQFRFSESPSSRDALTSYRIAGSSVLSFVADHCRLEAGLSESASRLYHAYQIYARETGLKAVSQKRFWGELKEEYGELIRYKDSRTRRMLYKGIALEEEESWGDGEVRD
jgi:putative DNA primase/helicase